MAAFDVKGVMDKLGIPHERFRALGVLPLVEVAWADGQVNLAERSAIRRFAKRKGWDTEGGAEAIAGWISQRPERSYFEDGRRAFLSLVHEPKGLGASIPEDSLRSVLLACHDVARASGSLFGLRDPINEQEGEALDRIASDFGLGRFREAVAAAASDVPKAAGGPRGHLLVGVVPEFQKDPIGLMMGAWREFGDVVRLEFGPVAMHLLVHPDHVKHVLVDNNRNYARSVGVEAVKEFIGDGLLTSDGEFWKKQRRISQPAFHMAEIASMASTMTQLTAEDLPRWIPEAGERTAVDVMEKLRVLTLRIAGITLFSVDLSDESGDFGRAATVCLKHTVERSRAVVRLPLGVPTEANRRFLDARATVDSVIYTLIEDRRSGKSKAAKKDLLQMLLDVRDPETGEGMNDKELRDELLTMLGAGHETTAIALTWTCYFLSKYPAVREKLAREVDSVVGDRTPTLDDLPKMPYARMVLEESMRLRSPFWLTGRKAIAEDSIGGYTIEAGTEVILMPFLTHRHPDFWDNPEGFDPDRFTEEKVKERHPYAMFAFGGGPRKCIGVNFAMMEMQLVLPMIVRAFDLWLIPGGEPELDPGLTLRPRDGCWMTLHRR